MISSSEISGANPDGFIQRKWSLKSNLPILARASMTDWQTQRSGAAPGWVLVGTRVLLSCIVIVLVALACIDDLLFLAQTSETSSYYTPSPAQLQVSSSTDNDVDIENEPRRTLRWLHIPKTGSSFAVALTRWKCPRLPADEELSICTDVVTKKEARNRAKTSHRRPLPAGYRRSDTMCLEKIWAGDPPACDRNKTLIFLGHRPDKHRPDNQEIPMQEQVTMFRRPSQRIVSAFRAGRHSVGSSHKELVWSTSTVLEFATAPGIAGCQVKMLTGKLCAEDVADLASRVSLAKQAVDQLAFFGITDRWPESIRLFHAMFGGDALQQEVVNTHPTGRESGDASSSAEKDKLMLAGWRDEADEELFEYVEQVFARRLQAYGIADDAAR